MTVNAASSNEDTNAYSVLQPTRNAIIDDLNKGRFKPGERLPGERELAKLYGIGRSSMVKVLKQLENERYLERVPVYGTFVRRDLANRIEPLTLTVASMDTPEINGIKSPFAWETISEILRGLISESSKNPGVHLNWYCCPETTDETMLLHQIEDLMESDGIIFNGCGMEQLKYELFRRGKCALTLGPKLFYRREMFPVIDYDRWGIFPEYTQWLAKHYPGRPVVLLTRDIAECDIEELRRYKDAFLEGLGHCGVEAKSVFLPCKSEDYGQLLMALEGHAAEMQLEKQPLVVALNRSLLPPLCRFLRDAGCADALAGLIGGNAIDALHADIPHWQEPYFEMGCAAVKMLTDCLRNNKEMVDLVLPMHFCDK